MLRRAGIKSGENMRIRPKVKAAAFKLEALAVSTRKPTLTRVRIFSFEYGISEQNDYFLFSMGHNLCVLQLSCTE